MRWLGYFAGLFVIVFYGAWFFLKGIAEATFGVALLCGVIIIALTFVYIRHGERIEKLREDVDELQRDVKSLEDWSSKVDP
jgi:Flp pilus assembly protein TadB